MLDDKQWKAKEKEVLKLQKQLEELDVKRKNIADKIHLLKVGINQHNKKHKERVIKTDTEVYRMFGKPLKELTKEEYKVYYNARQRINRIKRKAKTVEIVN